MTAHRRALVVQPSINPPGGGNGVACWMIQALAQDYAVTLLTRVTPDFARADAVFGTNLSTAAIQVECVPPPRGLARLGHLNLLKDHLLLRRARRMAASFDVVATANNEGDLGRTGIQYIHYPKFTADRPDLGLRWFQGVAGVRVYQFVCALATGFRMGRMRRNRTLVNSSWTGRLVRARHGLTPVTLHPPVAGEFPEVPWSERRAGVACVGRIAREKRLEAVIEIVSRVRARLPGGGGLTLHIAGNADDRAYLSEIEALVRRHGEWVTLNVDLPRPQLLALLTSCRYGLHGMHDEHFGMAVAELLRAGTIPCAHNSGGQVEILGDRRLLYESDDDAVEKILGVVSDEALAAEVRAALSERADRFSSDRFVQEFRAHVQALGARPRVTILHPDLGLGGAERLIVDAAIELQARGHRVTIVTGGHDPARAFPETLDGTLDVRVHGAAVPLHLGGRLRAIGAILRAACGVVAIVRDREPPDLVICDVTPHVIPLLRMLRPRLPVLFYCHYPDRLLTPARRGLYKWYRLPLDVLEAAGTARASAVMVNSRYTARVFAETYPRMAVTPDVVYPGVDVQRWTPVPAGPSGRTTIVSVARFERAKNVQLAVEAFARLRDVVSPALFARLRLVLTGGFDGRLRDCVETREELRRRADAAGVGAQVDIVPSPPADELHALVAGALAVVYTPSEEHFGYVPVEAMSCARPVVAVAAGGPLETIVDGVTGFLVAPTADAFSDALARLVADPALGDRLGAAGRAHVASHFSRSAFGERLQKAVQQKNELGGDFS